MSTFALSDEDWASRFASPNRTEEGYFNSQGERDDVPIHHPPKKKPKDSNYREYMHDIEDEVADVFALNVQQGHYPFR